MCSELLIPLESLSHYCVKRRNHTRLLLWTAEDRLSTTPELDIKPMIQLSQPQLYHVAGEHSDHFKEEMLLSYFSSFYVSRNVQVYAFLPLINILLCIYYIFITT